MPQVCKIHPADLNRKIDKSTDSVKKDDFQALCRAQFLVLDILCILLFIALHGNVEESNWKGISNIRQWACLCLDKGRK